MSEHEYFSAFAAAFDEVVEEAAQSKPPPADTDLLASSMYAMFGAQSRRYDTLDQVKAALRRTLSSLEADPGGELVPILRTRDYYAAADARAQHQLGDDDPEQHLGLRRQLAEYGDEVFLGLATRQRDDDSVKPLRLVTESSLTRHQLAPNADPYHVAVANLARDAGPRLDSIASAGPPRSDHSFQWLLPEKEGRRYGHLLSVHDFGWATAQLLLLPAMVRALCRVLQCLPAHLVVTPFDQNHFYAGRCSDPLAMCMLGDITSHPHPRPDALLSRVPLAIIDASETDDTKPVTWEKYQCHGTPVGMVGYGMEPQYVVPLSEAAADKLAAGMHSGLSPPLMKLQFTDQCFGCRRAAGVVQLKACAKCRTAVYCSAECQKEDWKQHKVFCKKVCDSGQLGTGPAAPTQGTAIVTPFTYRL